MKLRHPDLGVYPNGIKYWRQRVRFGFDGGFPVSQDWEMLHGAISKLTLSLPNK